MGSGKNTKKNSPRTSFGGNGASQKLKPRARWHWVLVGIVLAGIIGFLAQMFFIDPDQLSATRLQFLIGYAIVLFVCSIALGIVEWRRYRRKK